jgi:hypothetical protein
VRAQRRDRHHGNSRHAWTLPLGCVCRPWHSDNGRVVFYGWWDFPCPLRSHDPRAPYWTNLMVQVYNLSRFRVPDDYAFWLASNGTLLALICLLGCS